MLSIDTLFTFSTRVPRRGSRYSGNILFILALTRTSGLITVEQLLSLPQDTVEIFSFFFSVSYDVKKKKKIDLESSCYASSTQTFKAHLKLRKKLEDCKTEVNWTISITASTLLNREDMLLCLALPGGKERRVQCGQSGCQNRF